VKGRNEGAPTYLRPGPPGSRGPITLLGPRAGGVPRAVLQHRVAAGDRLDLLAARYFGDAQAGWRIADANPCLSPDELLEPGRVLFIPRGAE
jgi:phage tail protein X